MTLHDRYSKWNDAIIKYVTQGLNTGERTFLSIDNDALEIIGASFDEPRSTHGWAQDFIQSIRRQCIRGDRIGVDSLIRSNDDWPICVAFLAFMVLAAYHMGDEDEDRPIDPTDYFTHFNRLMNLPAQEGRPSGLFYGSDEYLWLNWNLWLLNQGFLPTAHAGAGALRYLQYPISQALLRESDKNRLWRHFTESSNWRKTYDEALLMQRIRRDATYLTTHLQTLFDSTGQLWSTAYDAISSACYEVYEEWCESGGNDEHRTVSGPRLHKSIKATIYRSPEDFLTGEVEYRIFPRQARHMPNAKLTVAYGDAKEVLIPQRPGWYTPLQPPLTDVDLTNGRRLDISSAGSAISALYLPARDFWVLTPDPDSPGSGIYASWEKGVELGVDFILLAREHLRDDIDSLKDRNLLEWQDINAVFERWYEYRGVTILSEPIAWSSLTLQHDNLLSLEPRAAISINLIGGLRAPGRLSWFVGYPPRLSLASATNDAHLSIYDENNTLIYTGDVRADDPELTELPSLESGYHKLVVEQAGRAVDKLIRMLSWDDAEALKVDFERIARDHNLAFYGTETIG